MNLFKKPLNSIAVIFGGFLVALLSADFFMETQSQNFGNGVSTNVKEDSILAVSILCLIVGMLIGIGMFFVYLVVREKKQQTEQDELALLLDEVSRDDTVFDAEDWLSTSEMPEASEENTQALDPWERGADWWKNED